MTADHTRRCVALVQPERVCDWERDDIPQIMEACAADSTHRNFWLTQKPADADLIVLLEPNIYRGPESIADYESLPLLDEPYRLCCINYEDRAAGFLPGIYTSLHRGNFDPALHVSWPALHYYNEAVYKQALEFAANGFPPGEEEWLYSFAGSISHPVRRLIMEAPRRAADRGCLVEVKRWYDHTEAEKNSYVGVMAASTFVLCPHGTSAYSHRILEALALGKVPVIIADDWVPFSVGRDDYYVRIREADAYRIADILRTEYASTALELKTRAQAVYRQFFDVRYRHALAIERALQLFDQHLSHLTKQDVASRVRSRAFRRANGWAIDQRAWRRFRQFLRR